MLDYGQLAAHAKRRVDEARRAAEGRAELEQAARDFFKLLENTLAVEVEKANTELKKFADLPTFTGPRRPFKDEEMLEMRLGRRRPCARVSLEMNPHAGSDPSIRVEFFDQKASVSGSRVYSVEREERGVRVYHNEDHSEDGKDQEAQATAIAQYVLTESITEQTQ